MGCVIKRQTDTSPYYIYRHHNCHLHGTRPYQTDISIWDYFSRFRASMLSWIEGGPWATKGCRLVESPCLHSLRVKLADREVNTNEHKT